MKKGRSISVAEAASLAPRFGMTRERVEDQVILLGRSLAGGSPAGGTAITTPSSLQA